MAEVSGIGPTDPNGVGDDSLNALKGITGLQDYMKQSVDIQQQILNVLLPTAQKDDTIFSGSTSSDAKIDALVANTMALNELSDTITSATLDVTVNGTTSPFFNKLVETAGNPAKLKGMETFTQVFESAVIRMSNLGKYTVDIDKVASSMLGLFGTFKEFGKGMLMFAGGLALLGFTLVTFMEAITMDDILTFAGIMLVLAGASRLMKSTSWDLAKASVGIATLGLAVWGFTELIDSNMAFDFMLSMGGVAAGVKILGLISGYGGLSGSVKAAVSIAAIAGSVWVLNKAITNFDAVDIEKVAKIAVVTGGLATVWGVMGKFMAPILQGSLAAAAIGGSLFFLSKGVSSLEHIDMSLERGLELAAIIAGTAGILTLLGNPVTIGFTLAGAAGAAAIGAALIVLSAGIAAVGATNITAKQGKQFGTSVGYTIEALAALGNPLKLPFILAGMAQAAAVAASTIAMSAAIYTISKVPLVGSTKYEDFSQGINTLVDVFSNIGGPLTMIKLVAGAGVMASISGATILTAGAILAFTKLSAKPGAVDMAILSLDNFVTGLLSTFDKNSDKFGGLRNSVGQFFGLSNMTKEIADSVFRIGNMEFLEKSVVNGKVVTTGVRKFTTDDFQGVGESIGAIIKAITDPLAEIGSSKGTWSIGGMSITNPFSNKVQDGIEAMSNIGSVFMPLTSIIDAYSKNNVDSAWLASFKTNLAAMLGGISYAFSASNIKIDEDDVELLGLAAISVNSMMEKTLDKKFKGGTENFKSFSKDLVRVKKSINQLDLGKLSEFNTMLWNLNELGKSDAMEKLVEVFSEFIQKLVDLEGQRDRNSGVAPLEPMPLTQTNTNEKVVKEILPSSDKIQELLADGNEEVVGALNQIYEYLASGNLRVVSKDYAL